MIDTLEWFCVLPTRAWSRSGQRSGANSPFSAYLI